MVGGKGVVVVEMSGSNGGRRRWDTTAMDSSEVGGEQKWRMREEMGRRKRKTPIWGFNPLRPPDLRDTRKFGGNSYTCREEMKGQGFKTFAAREDWWVGVTRAARDKWAEGGSDLHGPRRFGNNCYVGRDG
jgi:hypothetical protein